MADALSAVLELAAQHQQQQQQQVDNLNSGIALFNQQKQASQQNQLGQLQVRAGLAQNALQLGQDGSISYNPQLLNPYQQAMAKLQALSAAKQTGIPEVFQQMKSNLLGAPQGQGQPNTAPSTYQQLTGQVNQMLAAGGQSGQISPNVATPSTPNVNSMLTLGQSVSTDPVTGVPSVSQNQVNLPAQALQSTQAAQIPSQVAASKAAAEAQTNADSGAADYKNIYNLASQVDKSGYLGDWKNTSLYKLSPRLAPPVVQQNITDLENSIKRSAQSAQISNTATLGEGVAKRIAVQAPEIGKDSTIDQVKGWVKSNVRADYYKEIATKQFSDELATQGLNPNQITPDKFGAGVMKYWGKLNPDQEKELQARIGRTLAPAGAFSYDGKLDKFYDAQGKEIK